MISRIMFISVIIDVFFITYITTVLRQHGPGGMEDNETTTCDEFSRYARFNPYSVLNSKWMVFYYWAPPQDYLVYKFYVPGEKETAYLKNLVNSAVDKPVNWTSKYVLMKEKSNNTCLLVERSDRGEYDLYELYAHRKGKLLEPVDVRFKQTGDNLYIAYMQCRTDMVFVLARIRDVPHRKHIQDAAARIGYRGRGGKSLFYQGHQWMPIPEREDTVYWRLGGPKDF